MRRRPAVVRRAFVPFAILALLAGAACAKGKESADSARPAASATPAQRLASAAPDSAGTPPGALTKPLAQYTPDEFAAFVHALTFGGGADRPRNCRNAPGCGAKGTRLTSARVDAVDGQDSLRVNALPANGVVAIRARNTGQYEEGRYGLRPGAYEYYVVVMPGADGKATWNLQQLETTAGHLALTSAGTGAFKPCNHPFRKRANRANFYTCTDSHMANDSTMKMGLMFQDGDRADPMWVSCSMGCCTVDGI